MIIVDQALEEREQANDPIQVGIVGAGYMGRGLVLHITENVPGMRAAAVFNRTLSRAEQAYDQAGFEDVKTVSTVPALEHAIADGRPVIVDDPDVLCQAGNLDVIIEATGTIEFGARVALNAIEHGKHIVLMNAELDATVGPILKTYADRAGVVYTNVDGDQPGVVMNLYRFVRTIGCEPVVVGNIKGLLDPYRTPTTQAEFARKNMQDVHMVTSFADGTKLSMEQAVIANATEHGVARRGMHGPPCDHVSEALDLLPLDDCRAQGGVTDYILGADPLPGVFVVGYNDNAILRQYASTLKMGDGPYYVFYVPYHLPHLETPITVARAELFGDAAITPKGAPVCEVITVAKKDLSAGDTLDGIGGYTSYGVIDNIEPARSENLLPMGLSGDCKLKRDVRKDEAISYDDVEVPAGRLCDRLREEQNTTFAPVGAVRA
ncbi:MAG: Gfo/Idh/MocA family oxidoreductase [Bacteroidetes bacterium]|jgi:predicted homoserine dehydrogenase-like protein|nr:Gfo/Idh/MocA family oxidoreductase [Bacteroidota bacterium]